MPHLRFLSCLLVGCFGFSVAAARPQNLQLSAPKLAQLQSLYVFVDTLERSAGFLGVAEWMEKTGLQLLLLPAEQATWAQKGLASDKPFVLQTTSGTPLACMGVANGKALAEAVNALPGEAKTTQKGTLNYRLVRTSPTHNFVLFWNASRLCLRPQPHVSPPPPSTGPTTTAPNPKELEEVLAKASALSKTFAKQAWPMLSQGDALQIQIEPISSKQLKLHIHSADMPWGGLRAAKREKTVLTSVSSDAGVLLKLHGIPAAEVFKRTDLMAALSPKNDALLSQKQTWFSNLSSFLADEFLIKIDYPEGRPTERFLLVAKINPGSESAFEAWLAQMPKDDAAAGSTLVANAASLSSKRGPLVFSRKGSWAFAASSPLQAAAQIEQLEKAKPEAAPHFVSLAFPKTLSAVFQGETFISAMLGLSSRQTRLLMFNLPLKSFVNTLSLVKAEAWLEEGSRGVAELLLEISPTP